MTERLYYHDPTMRACRARVLQFDALRNAVALDRSCAYPEGGGQPGDRGVLWVYPLEGANESAADAPDAASERVPFIDTFSDEAGHVWHRLNTEGAEAASATTALREGQTVRLELDWQHRFEYMQQHTGQHIISAALKRIANLNTVSVAQGTSTTAIEVDRELDVEGADRLLLQRVQAEVNERILENLTVRAFEVDDSELERYALRRATKRSGRIRLVEIHGYDLVACGGVHLPGTAPVRLVQSAGIERIRGRARLHWLIGERAVADYAMRHERCEQLGTLFSCAAVDVADRAREAAAEVQRLNGVVRRQAERIAAYMTDEMVFTQDKAVLRFELENEEESFVAALTRVLCDRNDVRACVVNRGSRGVRWAIVDTRASALDFKAMRAALPVMQSAKGGGRAPLWQGVLEIENRRDVTAFLDEVTAVMSEL